MLQKGQSILIVVLVMVVALTVGLSVASRTITNLKISTEEENSQRAFSAAEAGVEEAIKSGCITPIPPGTGCTSIADSFSENKSSFNTQISVVSGDEFLVNGGNLVEMDDGTDVWFVPHKQDGTPDYSNPNWTGNLTIFWGSSSDVCSSDASLNTMAALEIILLSGTINNPVSTRFAVDPCADRIAHNNFSQAQAGGTVAGKNFAFKTSINVGSPGFLARIVPLYHSASMGISGNGTALPQQGQKIESTGVSGLTNRKISYYKGYLEVPAEFFQFVLFSPK